MAWGGFASGRAGGEVGERCSLFRRKIWAFYGSSEGFHLYGGVDMYERDEWIGKEVLYFIS